MAIKLKKILLFTASLFFYGTSFGDVIPSNAHYVEKCVKITNADDYQDISLIGVIFSVGGDNDCYLISSSMCLYKGYKFNAFYVYAVSNNYLAGKDIQELDWNNDKNAYRSCIDINPYYGYIADSNPLSAVEEYYEIMGFTDTTVVLHKWKEINKYNNGTPDSVTAFEYEGDLSSLFQHLPTYNEPSGFTVYPNPSAGTINIRIDNSFYGSVKLDIIALNGRTVKSYLIKKEYNRIHFGVAATGLSKGTYLLKFQCGEMVEAKKVLID